MDVSWLCLCAGCFIADVYIAISGGGVGGGGGGGGEGGSMGSNNPHPRNKGHP